MQIEQGNLVEALRFFNEGLAIFEHLARADANNSSRQRDLSVAYSEIGEVHLRQGNLEQALKSFRAVLDLRQRLSKNDPLNLQGQDDLAMAYTYVGDILARLGQDEAAKYMQDAVDIAENLVKSHPKNSNWQHTLATCTLKLGDIFVWHGDITAALICFRKSLKIIEHLSDIDPANVEWKVQSLIPHWRLAQHGDDPVARFSFIKETLTKLKREDRLNSERIGWLSQVEKLVSRLP